MEYNIITLIEYNNIMKENYCNNCGKQGHLYHQCKLPITSIGIVLFRYNKKKNKIEYLMICRKDTLGYVDFMRGKYSVFNKDYIINMIKQMTIQEKIKLKTYEFEELWINVWGDENLSNQYKVEEIISKEKFKYLRNGISIKGDFYNLSELIDNTGQDNIWDEPEWGFPKGRRNYQEKDFECAIREFGEETGLNIKKLKVIENLLPFEEIFTGSNYKSYKHKYYLMAMNYDVSIIETKFEKTEVSSMEWKCYDDCMKCIRPYNLEKKRLITNIHECLNKYTLFLC